MSTEAISTVGWLAIKLLFIVGFGIYALYAGIMVRQERIMAEVFGEASEPILRLLAVIHLIASLVVLVLAIIIL